MLGHIEDPGGERSKLLGVYEVLSTVKMISIPVDVHCWLPQLPMIGLFHQSWHCSNRLLQAPEMIEYLIAFSVNSD